MKKDKPTYSQILQIFTAVGTAVALILLAFGLVVADPAANQPEARGVTNFDSLSATALDVAGSPTFGTSNMYPLLTDTSSQGIYVGRSTITGTATILAATHGLSSITAVFCTMGQTPSTASGAAALCWTSFTGTTATITVEQDDWTTNATGAAVINYAIVGTP